jgi:hypothetical protein
MLHFCLFKAAGTAPQSMVADFLINHQEDCDKNNKLYQELEAMMKAVAATVYIGGHWMLSSCYALIITIFHSWSRHSEA